MKVIGIKFKDGGKIYYFAPNEGEEYAAGTNVVVETSKGLEFAEVAFPPKDVEDSEVVQPLRPIVRIATEKDVEQVKRNRERKPQAMKIAQEKIEKHGLAMKLIDCEFAFDGSKVIFYFSAESRVDFRELVKDLAGAFRIRIELRQIGVRDETRLLGGIAPCGRECCCAGAMSDFKKVSIKMAKVQGLSLNPGKISGLCGRLMCCLSYENDYYSDVYKKMPKVGAEVSTPEGKGTVASVNMLKLTVRVKQEKDGAFNYKDFPLDDIRFRGKKDMPEEEPDDTDEEIILEEEDSDLAPEGAEKRVRPERKDRPEKDRGDNNRDKNRNRGENSRGENRGDRGKRREKNRPERGQGERFDRSERKDRPERERDDNNRDNNRGENRGDRGKRREKNRSERGQEERFDRSERKDRPERERVENNRDNNRGENSRNNDRENNRKENGGAEDARAGAHSGSAERVAEAAENRSEE